MIFTIQGIVTLLGMVTVLRMATNGMMTNDHHKDSGHPWGRLEDFDHFGEGDLLNDVCLSVNLWVIELLTQLKIAPEGGPSLVVRGGGRGGGTAEVEPKAQVHACVCF